MRVFRERHLPTRLFDQSVRGNRTQQRSTLRALKRHKLELIVQLHTATLHTATLARTAKEKQRGQRQGGGVDFTHCAA